jgi:hypothetical protein
MWAITSYYNPVRYTRRLSNYRIFRANLGIPLVAVELSFDGRFELTERDADILIQITGGAVLWQKERLLNIAIKAVPPDVTNIAWIDCDVIFERPDWADEAKKQLNEFNVVQLFSDQVNLSSEDQSIGECRDASSYAQGTVSIVSENNFSFRNLTPSSASKLMTSVGLAWAARRELLEKHGFYDATIVGGGDTAMALALYGQFEMLIERMSLNDACREHYLSWAHPYHQTMNERVGYVAGRIYHLWHGDIGNRAYVTRHEQLAGFTFEPKFDLAIGPNGAWQWARPRPELEGFLKSYFLNRAEDG